jgi:hypothetical protein
MIAFIDEHGEAYGVEPICRVLPIAPSTTGACWSPSEIYRPPKPRNTITRRWTNNPSLHNLNQMASGDPRGGNDGFAWHSALQTHMLDELLRGFKVQKVRGRWRSPL